MDSSSCYMDLLKLLRGFVKVVLCISHSSPNKTKVKFDQDIKACWSFCFELKMLNELKYTTSWVRCALGNVCICVCIWKQCRELRLMIALPGSVERSWSSTADWSFFSIALCTLLHFFSIALYSVLHFFSIALFTVLYFFTVDINFKCTGLQLLLIALLPPQL